MGIRESPKLSFQDVCAIQHAVPIGTEGMLSIRRLARMATSK